jgi:hypothetical protein
MAKFILGLLVGLVAGILISPYFIGANVDDLVHRTRAAIGRHVPVND